LIDWWAEEANINLALAQSSVLEGGKHIPAFNFNSRKPLAMLKHGFADCPSQPGSNADADNSGLSLLCMSRRLGCMPSLNDQFSGLIQKDPSCLG
jgi:hypothetical protein